ncbi:gamma-tubulin complex component 5-like isoform X1 [Prunus yedoensis var. nudiflora]|uniref:Gamma-tubulin complex component n=1 Tax=Prunus yedoensis var. nudiflora TaxID=2094558 RepID=A0A314US66_PRUYE|nr:gamma-tubulin complex component 5-like isoform X1 [Prunus yedoensis var. nudiflora]
MGKPLCYDAGNAEVSQGLINRLYSDFSDGIHFATPVSSLRTNELDLVRSVLQMLQGFSSSLFYWDQNGKSFQVKSGLHVNHLSHTSLQAIVHQFMYAATCLQLVEVIVNKIEKSAKLPPPTLRAFACSVSSWLTEEDYTMLLHLFIGSILPYIEGLDSWLFEGALDDPYEEMFFYANRAISVDEADFWEKSYLLRQLIRHIPMTSAVVSRKGNDYEIDGFGNLDNGVQHGHSIAGLSLSEVFCVSLSGLIGHGDHIFQYIYGKQKVESDDGVIVPVKRSEKIWCKFLVDTLAEKRLVDAQEDGKTLPDAKEENMLAVLRKAIFGQESGSISAAEGTNYTFGFRFGESEYLRSQDDSHMLQVLFPFPTLLPSFQDKLHMSELLPFQKNSTLPSRVLTWVQQFEPRSTPLPVVLVQECLTVYIQKQVDCIGRHILSKLMNGWKLMDELAVLRAIYLLGSGDLLQHFLTVIFNKLDKGETWDDDFELNTILQESIRNSADGVLLSVPDSLIVSLTKNHDLNGNEQPPNMASLPSTPRKSRAHSFGMDGLDQLKFTYKVSWPLELIANAEAIKKYNQVMGFLLKVKRAKFVLDKTRRWMWKGRGTVANNHKRHWLVEQKLLHFVDAFHQYVMDRVYHNAWRELCEGMTAARSLDEVIEVHELYLLTIQRQCFVVPDKLWALIASRINNILGLALDFYSIQLTLSGGTVSAIKAKCEMEVDRIEKQFDDCIAFLLRVLSFKLNVGHFPHLADLVTRINYNYFYMSDSGNLRTLPSSENVTSRLGKTFLGRTD